MTGEAQPRDIEVQLEELMLDPKNPRLEAPKDEAAIIKALCDFKVLNLAKDITTPGIGLNPMERLGLISRDGTGGPPFLVVEGNRRVCALKLLVDRDRAPTPDLKRAFKKLPPFAPTPLKATLFPSRESADIWLQRMHGGERDGTGRFEWDAQAKTRAGYSNYRPAALALLDHLVDAGFMTKEEGQRKLTVLDRPIKNKHFLAATGLQYDEATNTIRGTHPPETQAAALKELVRQVRAGKKGGGLHTRLNKSDYEAWSKRFTQTLKDQGLPVEPVEPASLPEAPKAADDEAPESTPEPPKKKRKKRRAKPRAPKVQQLEVAPGIEDALKELGFLKLQMLYHDLVTVDVERTMLVSVGIWSFLEALTAAAGRKDDQAFSHFLQVNKIDAIMGERLPKAERKALAEVIQERHRRGNTTKHSATAGDLSAAQLVADWNTLQQLLEPLVRFAIEQSQNVDEER